MSPAGMLFSFYLFFLNAGAVKKYVLKGIRLALKRISACPAAICL
jgi:hypothetical protein